MADYQHFNTFNLYDPITKKIKNSLDDFGGIIINTSDETYDRECMPQMNFTTDKNDTRDGEIFIRATRGIRNIDNLTMLFSEEHGGGDLFELKKWLGKSYQQWFTWDGDDLDVGIWAIEEGNWKSQIYYGKKFYGKIQLKFVAHDPYYYKTNEKDVLFTNLITGYSNVVRCAGNCDSYPLIKITPNTNILSFKWNQLDVILKNLTIGQTYYLDCELCKCYYISNGIKIMAPFGTYSSDKYIEYPTVYCEGTNTFTITNGSASSLKVQLNSRII